MKITKRQLKKLIKEAQWGNFTGGAAPLDMPVRDSGPVPKDQLRKLADIFINDMGMTPEEVLQNPEFVDAGVTDLAQLKEVTMKITTKQLKKLIREAMEEKPSHFGGGKNIDVFGYKTQHFDICKSATLLFESLVEEGADEELSTEAAEALDDFFGIEKNVVEDGKASTDDLLDAMDLLNVFSMKMGQIGERSQEDYSRETGFVKMHIDEIIKRLQ